MGISEATFYVWKKKYGRVDPAQGREIMARERATRSRSAVH
jgi:hypothetical protein